MPTVNEVQFLPGVSPLNLPLSCSDTGTLMTTGTLPLCLSTLHPSPFSLPVLRTVAPATPLPPHHITRNIANEQRMSMMTYQLLLTTKE